MLPSRVFFDNFLDDIEPKKMDKMMKCDIYEENNMYHIVMDAPGFKKEDIKIEFDKGNLKISLFHKEHEHDNKKYVHRERTSVSRCERSFYLGEIDENEIKAEFKDGILKISVPKEENTAPSKKIISID